MAQRIVIVDAFTDRPFAGNPAAVCRLEEPADPQWMQRVAAEMNLSETAFLHREDDGYRLRWFTPRTEVELCGHATLAAAHHLWEEGVVEERERVVFQTRSGRLTAERDGRWIELDFPADPVAAQEPPAGLEQALGTGHVRSVGRSGLYLLVEVSDESELRRLSPDFTALPRLHPVGVCVTAPSEDERYDFVSRFFAPAVGIDEDPVTGSAHCSLGPLWGERLGRRELLARQLSERGGVVRVRLAGDRVRLGGRAITVLRGRLDASALGSVQRQFAGGTK